MHMYRVIQTDRMGLESTIALHGWLGQAIEQANHLGSVAHWASDGLHFHADAEPVEATFAPIKYEEN